MHAKPDLRVVLKWTIAGSGSVITDVIPLMKIRPTPQTIWKRPAYLPYVQMSLTDDALLAAEKQLGHELPIEFVEILKVQNGGPIRFKLPDSVGDTIAGIGSKFPSLLAQDLADAQEYVSFPLNHLIAFDGDGHWYHCLDYRDGNQYPCVSYIDVECDSQHRVANSFAEFMGAMELDLEREMVLAEIEDFEHAKQRLQDIIGVVPEDKTSNIGIPYSKYQIGDDWQDCLWISSNLVAAGYSGDSPSSFKFDGATALFPELLDEAVIFECPVERLDSYRDLLQTHEMKLLTIEQAANAG